MTCLINQITSPKGPNLLLTASILGRLDIVRKLVRNGWTPKAEVNISAGDPNSTIELKTSTV